jgi:hypothetical protein
MRHRSDETMRFGQSLDAVPDAPRSDAAARVPRHGARGSALQRTERV